MTNILNSQFLQVKNPGLSLVLWPRVSHKSVVKVFSGVLVFSRLRRGGAASELMQLLVGLKSLLVGGQRQLFPCYMGLLVG